MAARSDTTKVGAPFCRVIGVATPTSDSHIGFEVWLPPACAMERQIPGRGFGRQRGRDLARPHADALLSGYATMSTDNGHLTDPSDPLGGSGQRWA